MSVKDQSRWIIVNSQILHLSLLHLNLHLLLSLVLLLELLLLVHLLLHHQLLLRMLLPLLHQQLLLLLSGSLLERRSWGTVLPRANPGSASRCKTPKYLSFYILIFTGLEISLKYNFFFSVRGIVLSFYILISFPIFFMFIADLEFVATVVTSGRVKVLSSV